MINKNSKKRLINRLQWTFQVEGMNVVMFFGIMIFLNFQYSLYDIFFLSYGLFLMCFILFQGTYYWWIKYSVLTERPVFKSTALSRFRSFKRQSQLMITLIPVVLIIQWLVSGKTLSTDNLIGWAVFANLFGVCEYINYYHKQLMYDNRNDLRYLLQNRKLKEASLHKDLRENKI
ncbi:hypothetical protein [Gracilimonas sp. BCB1]|uniref:hypothetical protein n=1 Tax=Gracilimonas sp. BCB1 TaxID=3152362 RepID=UPI0032D8C922